MQLHNKNPRTGIEIDFFSLQPLRSPNPSLTKAMVFYPFLSWILIEMEQRRKGDGAGSGGGELFALAPRRRREEAVAAT